MCMKIKIRKLRKYDIFQKDDRQRWPYQQMNETLNSETGTFQRGL